MAERLLIVSADDYGLTPGVCDAILAAHESGVVSSTSVITIAPAFAGRSAALRDSGLAAGAHLTAVGEDPPLLSATEVPTLVDRRGRLRASWKEFLRTAMVGAIDPADLRREFGAQLDALVAAGIAPTHLDTHQHLHLWPPVARVVVELAARAGVGAVRLPGAAGPGVRALSFGALSTLLAHRLRAAGLSFPDRTVGPEQAGHLTAQRLQDRIRALGRSGAASAELITHPGPFAEPALERYRWGYDWSGELRAVCSAEVRRAVADAGFRLGSFADLVPAGPGTRTG